MDVSAMVMATGCHGEGGGEGHHRLNRRRHRQSIEIKPIPVLQDIEAARHVCFATYLKCLTRRSMKLCARTGAHLAFIVSSPAGKPHSFAHPSVNAVIDRYLNPDDDGDPSAANAAAAAVATRSAVAMCEDYGSEFERLQEALVAEARRRDELDAAARAAGVWTDEVVSGLEMPSLVAMLADLERVWAEVADRAAAFSSVSPTTIRDAAS